MVQCRQLRSLTLPHTGSPNGIGAGYFLAQHKAVLGNKIVSKITVWSGSVIDSINLLFWVADELEPDPDDEEPELHLKAASKHLVERNVVEKSGNSRHLLRKHVFRARL